MVRVLEEEEQPRLVSVASLESVEQDGSPGASSQDDHAGIMFEHGELEGLGVLGMQQETEGDNDQSEQLQDTGYEAEAAGGSSSSSRKRPLNSGEMESNPRNRPPPPPNKVKPPAEYIEKYESRAQKALRSGRTLEKLVGKYQVTTGAKVYFKGLFKYKDGRELKFEAGEDFKTPEETTFSLEEANETLRSTVVQTITNLVRPSPGPSSSTASSAFSPSVNAPQRLDQSRCRICGKKEVSEGLIVFPSEWIQCNLGTNCNYKVHADCLGFPGMTRVQLRNMPNFYCQRHKLIGRQREGLQPAFAGSSSATEDDTQAPRGRGRGRGRGQTSGRTRRGRGRDGKT